MSNCTVSHIRSNRSLLMNQKPQRLAFVRLIVALFFIIVAAAPSFAEETLYQRVRPACIDVLADGRHVGSGWIADADGLAFTAGHAMVRPNQRLEVLWADGSRTPAELIALDRGHDAALLQLPEREGGYPAVPFANATPPAGEEVLLVASPIYRPGVMISGMVGRDETAFEHYGKKLGYAEVIHLSGNVVLATSGGPWFDAEGCVVGLQSGSIATEGVPGSIAFMAPVEALATLLEAGEHASTATLGAAFEEPWQHGANVRNRFPADAAGLLVREIRNDGPAAQAGLQEWDLILTADGEPVLRSNQLLRILRDHTPGDTMQFEVLSPDGAEQREVEVTLGHLEAAWTSE